MHRMRFRAGSPKERFVSGVPKWGRSSKRRVRLIRRTRSEIVSAAGLGGVPGAGLVAFGAPV
jgi:hypothetical protein